MDKLSVKKLGFAAGILSVICMIIIGFLGNFGIYMGSVEMMNSWHMMFSLSFMGIILGAIEAFIVGGLFGAGIAYFYNLIN